MLVYGVNKEQLQECANNIGVGIEFGNPKGNALNCKLHWLKNDDNTYRHKSISWNSERWTRSVCFHGYFDFMWEVFQVNKEAKIVTSYYGRTVYDGFEDFCDKVPDVANMQIGAPIMGGYPSLIESCECNVFGYGIKHDLVEA